VAAIASTPHDSDEWPLPPLSDSFCLLERLDRDPIDFRFAAVSPALDALLGGAVIGETVRTRTPRAEAWLAIYDAVLRDGEPRRFERAWPALGRTLELRVLPAVTGGLRAVALVINDVERAVDRRLVELNRGLVGSFDFQRVTEVICRAARELTGADGATFVVRDGGDVQYVAEDAIAPLWKGQRFPIHQCVSGWSIANARTAVIGDIYTDERVPHAAYRPTFVSSMVMMPVGPGSPVASIGTYWAAPHTATDHELELLQSLASAADLALGGVRAHAEARRARADADEANRAKDELLASLSHELRNPLNVIAGYAELLRSDDLVARSAHLRDATAGIGRNVRAQAQLVDDLLDLSRARTGQLAIAREPCSLAPIVHEVVSGLRPAIDGKALAVALELEPVVAFADPVRVQQILWNLVDNAVKFTPRAGRIAVRVRRDGARARIEVADSGKGIEPAFLPRVFEIFQQAETGTTRAVGGLGIGLSLVRQLVELHTGTITAHSDGPGLGASFVVDLPLHEPTTELAAPRKLAGRRILVVDDIEDAAEILAQLLVGEGAIVATAMSGLDGLRSIERGEFDLIISDISMPEMDGYQFITQVRTLARYQRTPAIALTGLGREADQARSRQAGFTSHVTKPVNFADLVALVSRALA
jgi:two-component system CheB/CheR fusion protein